MSRREERGAVTSWALVVAAALVVVALAAVSGGAVLVTQRRAAAAADLGALAGAVALQHRQDGCGAARRIVVRHDARLQRCRVRGERVRVTVVKELGVVGGRTLSVSARAHAGPR